MFADFLDTYGSEILMTAITTIFGALAIVVKNLYTKYVNDKTKESVVKTVVRGIEQVYHGLNGEDKLNKALETASTMLSEKGIAITELELRMMIEAAVGEFNDIFNSKTKKDTAEANTIEAETETAS